MRTNRPDILLQSISCFQMRKSSCITGESIYDELGLRPRAVLYHEPREPRPILLCELGERFLIEADTCERIEHCDEQNFPIQRTVSG